MKTTVHLEASTARAFVMHRGERLTVTDPRGKQVADLVAFMADDHHERLDAGRTFDAARTLRLSTGHTLYSNRSRAMLVIRDDTVGRHDFLFAPCSREMFRVEYGIDEHPSCVDALSGTLGPFGIGPDDLSPPFNIFMNVEVDGASGALTIRDPLSVAGSSITFEACSDLLVAVSACSAEKTNAGELGPIDLTLTKP